LGVIKNFQIKTRLPAKKAIGFLHRNYPPFSMSHTVLKMLKYASETIDQPGASPLLALIGEKGAGKTSSAEMVGYLVDGVAPEVFHCGDKSLDDLLFEPVIAESSKSLMETLEERYKDNSISGINRSLLEKEVPEAILMGSQGQTLDLSRIHPDNIKHAVEIIKTVVHLEGIGNQSGIGISYQEGPLIRTWKNAVEAEKTGKTLPTRLIIDEIDKRLPNSGKSLQQVWLVLQGLSDSTTVSKNGVEFTFARKEMPKGFSVVITGNDDRDLSESAGFSQSQASRMTILSIEKPSQEDLTHRICQSLCGIPLLSLELLKQDSNKKAQVLQGLRTLGDEEQISEEELWLIKNHEKTLQAAKQLAAFYDKWAELVDPETGIDDPILEATAAFREPPSVRMAQSHIRRSKANDIIDVDFDQSTPSSNPLESLLNQASKNPEPPKGLGERIERIILESVQLSAGSPGTKAKILEIARSEGIITETDEEDNPNKNRKTIRDLLATEKESFVITEEAKILQKQLHRTFVTTHKKEFKGKIPTPEELVPVRNVQAALNQLIEQKEKQTTDSTTYILNINPSYVTGNSTESPIECIPVLSEENPSHVKTLREMSQKKDYSTMIPTKTLVTLLQTPKIADETLSGLWDAGWKKNVEAILKEKDLWHSEEEEPKIIQILTGSGKDLRIAKVLTKNEAGIPEPVIVLNFPDKKKTWVLSEEKLPVLSPKELSDGGPEDSLAELDTETTSSPTTATATAAAATATKKKSKVSGPQLKSFSRAEIPDLVEALKKELPENTFVEVSGALDVFFDCPNEDPDCPDEEVPTEPIEVCFEKTLTRKLDRTKVPLRINPDSLAEPNI
jgi:hypothetical protein